MLQQSAMKALVKGLTGPSAKIRALSAAGVSTADIARFLEIRYQHAYNVIKQSKAAPQIETKSAVMSDKLGGQYLEVGPSGQITIPPAFLDALKIKDGDDLLAKIEDGKLTLMTRAAVLRNIQATIKKYVPEGVSLVDELIAERRAEAAKEMTE